MHTAVALKDGSKPTNSKGIRGKGWTRARARTGVGLYRAIQIGSG